MASLNFDESIVLVLFAQSIGNASPSQADLVQFDAGLQSAFGATMLQIMGEEGMTPDVHNRSVVLGCRPHMKGNTPDSQIRNACRYVMHAQQELGGPAIAAAMALASGGPAPAKPAKKGKSAKKAGGNKGKPK